jgi:hypothetical protein
MNGVCPGIWGCRVLLGSYDSPDVPGKPAAGRRKLTGLRKSLPRAFRFWRSEKVSSAGISIYRILNLAEEIGSLTEQAGFTWGWLKPMPA